MKTINGEKRRQHLRVVYDVRTRACETVARVSVSTEALVRASRVETVGVHVTTSRRPGVVVRPPTLVHVWNTHTHTHSADWTCPSVPSLNTTSV